MLRIKLRHLPAWTRQRQQLATRYTELLAGLPGLGLPQVAASADPVWHLYVVQSPHRDALRRHLAAAGIETLVHYPVPPHRQPAYAHLRLPPQPLAEALATTCLSLPLWPGLTEEQAATVAATVRAFNFTSH